VETGRGEAAVHGLRGDDAAERTVFCGESGSTLRFLLPVSLLSGGAAFTGRGRLMQRPLSPYRALFEEKGVRWVEKDGILRVSGTLKSGDYALAGNISSQFVSGLLFALPLLDGDSRIRLTTGIESRAYIDLTLSMQKKFGVRNDWEDSQTLYIPGGQRYVPTDVTVEGDWSHAAFYVALGAMGGDISLLGLDPNSAQGDRAVLGYASAMGTGVFWEGDTLRISGGELSGTDIGVSQTPDLAPALCALACASRGRTRIINAARLRAKESDRLSALHKGFSALGAHVEETPDSLIIYGYGGLDGGVCDSQNDHRIAMALTCAAAVCQEPVVLCGYECVKKSDPDFFLEIQSLGGAVNECDMGQTF
jgi:3-phosphoshikimate 1-carboxyvinyltransferase